METLVSTAATPPNKITVPGELRESYRNWVPESYCRYVTCLDTTRTYLEIYEEPDTSLGAEDPARLLTGTVYMRINDRLLPIPIVSAGHTWIVEQGEWLGNSWEPEETGEDPAAALESLLPNSDSPTGEMHDMAAHYGTLIAHLLTGEHDTSRSLQGNALWTAVPHFIRKNEETSVKVPTSAGPPLEEDLNAALYDLWQATEEAMEEGFPAPSKSALANANRLLKEIYGISRRRFEVYPTQDGDIAIDAPGGYGRSVLLLCDSQGGALCMVNMHGNHRRARYSTTEMLPDGFIRDALAELGYQDS